MRLCIGLFLLLVPGLAPPEKFELAPPDASAKLLEAYVKARDSHEAGRVQAALHAMGPYRNEEFRAAALEGLRYRATGKDRKAAIAKAGEMGSVKAATIELLVRRIEEGVQVEAARILGHVPGPESEKALRRAFRDPTVRKDRPKLFASVIRAFADLEVVTEWKEISSCLHTWGDPDVMRAAVRFLGTTREKRAFRALVNLIDRPTSPPGEGDLIEARNRAVWAEIKNDVQWALKRITGREFESAAEAREWLKEHGRKLGIR
jgi:hypothetical protein